jgi:hypothetical protein
MKGVSADALPSYLDERMCNHIPVQLKKKIFLFNFMLSICTSLYWYLLAILIRSNTIITILVQYLYTILVHNLYTNIVDNLTCIRVLLSPSSFLFLSFFFFTFLAVLHYWISSDPFNLIIELSLLQLQLVNL